jgi:hypothetical protein
MKKKCMAVGGTAKKPATMEEQLAGIRGKVRPGYQAGGIAGQVDDLMNRTKAMPNSIASAPQPYGGSVIPAQTGQQAMQSATNFGMPPAGTAPASSSQTISTGDYSTGPKETGFIFSDGTRRDGLTQEQAKQLESQQAMQRAQQSANAPTPQAAAPLMTMAEKESSLGLNPNRTYTPGSAMDPLASGGGISQALKVANPSPSLPNVAVAQIPQIEPVGRNRQRNRGFADGGILDKLIRTVGKILPESNGQKYEPGIQSRAAEDPARHGRAEALNPRTQTDSSDTPPAGGFQEEAERRRKQMKEAMSYEAGGLITPVNLGQGLYQAIAQPIAEDWRQGNAAIKKVRDQYPTADSLAGINPFVAAAQVANDVAAGNVGGDTAINVAQAVPVIKGLSGMAKMLTKQAGPTIGATKFVIDMPNTVRKNVALTTGQTLGQPANAFAAGGMVRFSGKGGPRDDQIPVKVAGQEINVSNGENAVILPAKTAANPAALQAINGIIQATNDGRRPKSGIEDGGKYHAGAYPYDGKRPPTAQELYGEISPGGIAAALTPATWRAAKVVAPPGSVGGGMSSSGTDPRDIPAGGTITNLAPALQQIHNFAKPAYDLSPSMRALGTVGYAVGNVFADSAEAQRQGTTYGAVREARIASEGRANAAPYSNEGRPSALGQAYESYRPPAQGITAGVANADARMQNVAANDGMTTTQMGAGFDPTKLQMAPGYGMATNAAGKTIAAGNTEYVGADGRPTSRWTDTQQYKDAIARNEADKLRLAEMQARRLGADPMAVQKASQGIAQSVMQAPLDARVKQQQIQQGDVAAQNANELRALYEAHKTAKTPEERSLYEEAIRVRTGKDNKLLAVDLGSDKVTDEMGNVKGIPRGQGVINQTTGQWVPQPGTAPKTSFSKAEVDSAIKAGASKEAVAARIKSMGMNPKDYGL